MQSQTQFIFKTTGGVTILATPEQFFKNWFTQIIDRGEAFTSEPLPKEVING